MINNIKISYIHYGVNITMSYEDPYSDNLPYALAEMFFRVIEDSSANHEIVIDQLKNSFPIDK